MADIYRSGDRLCRHPFDLLSTTLDRDLSCSGCGGEWPTGSQDAFEVLFIASAEEAVNQSNRISKLEEFITTNFSAATCNACGTWVDVNSPGSGARVGELWACTRHVGVATLYLDNPRATAELFQWSKRSGLGISVDARDRHRWEEVISCVPSVISVASDGEFNVPGILSVDPRLLKVLKLKDNSENSVEMVLSAMTLMLGLGTPVSPASRSMLLGILAASDLWLRGEFDPDDELDEENDYRVEPLHSETFDGDIVNDDDDELIINRIGDENDELSRLWRAIAYYSMPQLALLRAQAYVDLHGEDVENGTTIDGGMIDDLLVMTATRAAESLLGSTFPLSDL